MKSLIIIFFLAFPFFQSCGQLDPIVSDVCEITEEICYYANLVCENWNIHPSNSEEINSQKQELQKISNEIQILNFQTSLLNSNQKLNAEESVKRDLINIRDKLKSMYFQLKVNQ